jgi:hypothetical protein
MTLISRALSGSVRLNTFYLINPATGANTVATTSNLSNEGGVSVSYTGASRLDVTNSAVENQTNSTFTGSLTTSADNARVILSVASGDTQSAGTGATQRAVGGGGNSVGVYDNNANKTPAGAVSEQVNLNSSTPFSYQMFSLAPPITESVTDSMTLSESLVNGTLVSDAITLIQVVFENVSDAIGLTDAIASFKKGWNNLTKNSSTFTNQTKNTSTFTNQTKNNSTWTDQTKI